MHTLVHIETQEEATQEGLALNHAVGHLFEDLCQQGVLVYSVRLDETPVLTLSARKNKEGTWICAHVVGRGNRHPTQDELAIVKKLLAARKVKLQYDPYTIA
jgi:hypothetical protein